jgi:DUF1365 family protein
LRLPASAVYEGRLVHRRFHPREHRFAYRLGMICVDLDELPGALDRHPLWSARRFAPAWFRRADYLRPTDVPLREAVIAEIERQTGERPVGPVSLLTHPRYWGYAFNPVSFYYVFDGRGGPLRFLLADVTNTPWNERHAYVLGPLDEPDDEGIWHADSAKAMHVSPFMEMAMDYRWRFTAPQDRLLVHIENHAGGRRLFDATLALQRRPLTGANLGRLLWRYPALSLKVVAGIHWQALRLWRKGVPYVPHPARRQDSA